MNSEQQRPMMGMRPPQAGAQQQRPPGSIRPVNVVSGGGIVKEFHIIA
jgi:hypothetical protein